MKKKTIYFVAVLLIGMAACKEDSLEPIPLEVSFEVPDVALERYVDKINEAEYGWEFGLAGRDEGFYVGFLDFGAGGTARFTVDRSAETGAVLADAAYHYRVSGSNPVLGFPAGSAFSEFATTLVGLDTAFVFQAVSGDTIYLNGERYGSRLVLTRASFARAQAYREGGIVSTIQKVGQVNALPRYFKRLSYNGTDYDLHFDTDNKMLYIHYGGTERFSIHETRYGRSATGIYLHEPLIEGLNVIGYLDAFDIDVAAGTLSAAVNGFGVSFTNEAAPSAYDATAATTFYNNPMRQVTINFSDIGPTVQRYSRSIGGFTVAGIPDAYGVGTIPDYQYTAFFHLWGTQTYGTARFILGGTDGLILSSYGPAFTALFAQSGLMGFRYEGSFGTYPSDILPIVQNLVWAFTDQYGFYVVKSGPASYDLVAVNQTNGQKWIRFD